jgi:hypothetical protein
LHTGKISFQEEMETRYQKHVDLQLAAATGLKPGLITELQAKNPAVVKQMSNVLQSMMKLLNNTNLNADKQVIHDASVIDVFGLLKKFPAAYFENPKADHKDLIRWLMEPRIQGNDHERWEKDQSVQKLVEEFDTAYRDLMGAAGELANAQYGSPALMRRAVINRAGFENQPIDLLFRARLEGVLDGVVEDYNRGQPVDFRQSVDKVIAASVRSFDGLLAQGTRRKLPGGAIELEARQIDGVNYSVRALGPRLRRLQVSVPIEGSDEAGYVLDSLPGKPRLSREQLDSLRYRYTTDGWKTSNEIGVRLITDKQGKQSITFARKGDAQPGIPVLAADVGQLEGIFHATAGDFYLRDGASNFSGYTYAVPDVKDLETIATSLKR